MTLASYYSSKRVGGKILCSTEMFRTERFLRSTERTNLIIQKTVRIFLLETEINTQLSQKIQIILFIVLIL